MNLKAQKRLAAEVMKCGQSRIWMDPYLIEEVKLAITREDIRNLIDEGIIQKKHKKGISKSRKNLRHLRKKKGRARGIGKRKGAKYARSPKKRNWIKRIRPLRRELKKLRDRKLIAPGTYRKLYKNAKGGMFDSVAHLDRYIKENKLIKRGR